MKHPASPKQSLRGLLSFIGLSGLLAFLLTGCASAYTVQLGYRPTMATSAEKDAPLHIGDVTNKRDLTMGGDNDTRVGTIRGGYGNPWELHTKDAALITKVFQDLIGDAASELGYQMAPDGAAPSLSLVINQFWCDGMYGYKISIDADLQLVDPSGLKILASHKIQYDDGFVLVSSMNEVKAAYDKFLNRFLDEVESALKSDEFAKHL